MLSILYSKSPHHKSLALLFLLLTVSGVLLGSSVTRAGLAHDVGGWAWGGTQDTVTPTATGLGWVSMNSTDCDTNGDGIILGGEIGVNGCTAGGITNYGITIPAVVGGTLSGYAWSENYGWLSFSAADLASCPTGLCSARRTATGIEGWARILSLRVSAADGGWVKLAADASDTVSYEVTYDASGQTFGGYAFSDEVGWIDFAPVVVPPPAVPAAPTVTNIGTNCGGELIVSWGNVAGAANYDIQYREVGTTGLWTERPDASNPYTIASGLTPGVSYDVQVRAKNASGATSNWSGYGTGEASAVCAGADLGILNSHLFIADGSSWTGFNWYANLTGVMNNYGLVPTAVPVHTKFSYRWADDVDWTDIAEHDKGIVGAQSIPASPIDSNLVYRFNRDGTIYLRYCADSRNVVAELNEDNNCVETGGIVLVNVAEPSTLSLNPVPCSIQENDSSCFADVVWQLPSSAVPIMVENETTGAVISNAISGTESVEFIHGVNVISAKSIIEPTANIQISPNITCASGLNLFYNPSVSLCKKMPAISNANLGGLWIRSGQQAKINFSVSANYPVQCTAVGGVPAGSTINHSGVPTLQSHEFTTNPLPSTQVVEIACEVPGIPASREEVRVRINVLPIQQET